MEGSVIKKMRRLWRTVLQDPEALFELRQLVFGVLIALGVSYGFYLVHVQAKEKVMAKQLHHKAQLTASVGDGQNDVLRSLQLQKMSKTKKEIQEKISFLELKKRLLLEQYSGDQKSDSFTKVIFTLPPSAPVDIAKGFAQMSVLDTLSYEYYDIYPINLKGELEFSEFMHYLMYLERRPEVGMIGKIHLEHSPEDSFGTAGKIRFDVVLGRIQLHPAR